jgi:uncharacterized protein YecE (DUF72 family)
VDFEAFLKLLPSKLAGEPVRHAVEVRHPSFMTPEFLALVRRYGVATVFADSDKYPSFADPSGDLVYARIDDDRVAAQDRLSARADPLLGRRRTLLGEGRAGRRPAADRGTSSPKPQPRDVFAFFISGAKERAPERRRRRSPRSASSRSRCLSAKEKASRLPQQHARPAPRRSG